MKLRDFENDDMLGQWTEGIGATPDENIIKDSVKITVEEDGEVIACGGALVRDEVMFWMCVRENIKKPIAFMKMVKDAINIIMDSLGVEEAVAIVRAEFRRGHRTLNMLGFNLLDETVMYNNTEYKRYKIWLCS